jgi:hypothetical protein
MSRISQLDLCKRHLYTDIDKMDTIPANIRDRILRIRSGYTLWSEDPTKKDKEIALHIMQMYKTEKAVAYDDVRLIRDLLGSISKQSKDWHLYQVNLWLDEAVEMARRKGNEDGIIKAAKVKVSANQLDKPDVTEFPWEEIKPQSFEITSDPTVIGLKKIPNIKNRINDLFKKYAQDIQLIEDVTYEQIDIDPVLDYAEQE